LTNTPSKILTINFGGIGDEVLFLPTLEGIRATYPDAQITLLVEPRSAGIGVITDLVDEVVTFDIKKRPLVASDLIQLITMLRAGDYDMVVSSGSSPMVSGLLFLSGIPRRIGYNSNRLAPYLLTDPMPLNRSQYAGKMYHDLILKLSGASAALPAVPRIKAGEGEKTSMESLLQKLWSEKQGKQKSSDEKSGNKKNSQEKTDKSGKRKRVLFHPGTSRLAILKGLNKTWPAENWCKLAELLEKEPDVDVILAGGPDDKEAIGQIIAQLKPDSRAISTYGETRSLKDLVGLIDICDLTVCVDSAPMHLAIALDKPTVALFGPTNEAVLVPPAVEHFVVLRKEKLSANGENADGGSQSAPGTETTMKQASFLYPGAPAVQLPAEIVARSVLDLLKRVEHQGGSRAVRAD
jgi:ADP-heptose:LPS heptosyltransferase